MSQSRDSRMPNPTSISILAAIRQQILETRVEYREPLWIRVTVDAARGSVVALPIAPERLRVHFASLAHPDPRGEDGLLIASPDAQERYREILLHPEDWRELKIEEGTNGLLDAVSLATETPHVLGLPVRAA